MSLVPDTIVSLAEDDTIGGGKNIVAGAPVNITKATGGSASIFSDAAGTTAISLPTVTGSNGELKFWIAPGLYIYNINSQNYNVNISEPNDFVIENVAALASTPVVAGRTYYLKEYSAGTGVGGRELVGKAGSTTYNNITTFAGSGGYFESINIPEQFPAEFGGVHEGLTDCKTALEAVANYVYNRGGGVVTLGPGEFDCSSLVLPTNVGSPFYAGKIVHLIGAGKNATTLNITGSAGVSYDTDNSDAAYGGIISNMRLLNSGTANDGIYIPFGTQFHFLDMTIQGFLNSGIKTTHDIWLSSVQRCHIGGLNVGAHGVQMLASGTSNYFDQIFVSQTTDYAYRLGGGYSHVGTLAADDCGSGAAGSTIYLFNGFTGHVGALGAEINDAENIVHVLNSDISIGAFYFIANTVSSTKGTALLTQGGSCKVDVVSIVDNSTPSVANKMFKSISGKTIVGTITSDVTYTAESGDSTSGSEFLQLSNRTSALALRTGGSRSYLGYDRKGNGSTYLFGTVSSTAIFTDSVGSPLTTTDGVNRRYEVGAEIGDWFIESRPDLNHCAAYVARASNADLNAIDYTRIPIVIGGNTASRPTTRYLYMQYIDNTINKIIWWDGTNWRDAMGTVV